ncbi:MAG: AAA family ATPase [Acidimicrobiales bacterium]
MGRQTSPFVVSGPAPAAEVVGRHEILATLADRAAHGRFVLLTAPRRYGKTTIVRRLAADAEATRDMAVVIVDLLGVQTLDDMAVRMAHAWTRLPAGAAAKAAARVLPFVSGLDVARGVVSLHLRAPAASDARALEAVLDVPRAVAERLGRRVLVVLDEFQAVAEVERSDAVIRSQIQHHTDRVSYLFAGSDQSVTEMLFADRSRPLYGQAERVHLGPFDGDELATYVEDRLSTTGRRMTAEAMAAYLGVTEGHPQRSMLVADAAWGAVDDGGEIDLPELAAAVEVALERCREEFGAVVGFLSDAQARVARLVAWGEPLTGAAAARLRLSQGSARSAARVLVERGLLRAVGRRHGHVDPLLAEWFRRLGPRP